MDNQRGFSLIEMIVVVAILAISTGIAIPVYIGMKPSIRLNGATRQIMGDLMWARMRAVSENNDYLITFGAEGPDLSNNTYAIYDDNDGDFDSAGVEHSELVKSVIIPDTYKQTRYGYVPGIKETDNVTPLTDVHPSQNT
ncbi:MAG: prepilin-type N-terminal cleavage/methylation domain-containing protein [Candidatus Brocadia sp.]|nr:prepilin-type N-terminal cleavage/methylation domain-containing protein [Candidatus Brocadia sp.]